MDRSSVTRLAALAAIAAPLSLVGCGDAGPEVAGTANSPDPAPQRPEFERVAQRIFESESELLSRSLTARMEAALANPELKGRERHRLESALANRLLREGDVERSLALYDQLVAREEPGTQRHLSLVRARALAQLRRAEVENCIARHDAECCIFPLAGGGLHESRAPARAALDGFLAFLVEKPQHLPTRWLANVAAMALGEHPDALPEEQRIPRESFASDQDFPRFLDVAPRLGVDTFNLCGGVAVEDFDGDGLLDVLTSTYDPLGPLTHYRNVGDGTFEDVSERSRATDQLGGLNLVAADHDGDGDRDVLVLRGAWLTRDGRVRNSLLRNDGGTFVDVTREAGLAEPAYPTQAAAWGDFDRDGDLDLYVVNESLVDEDPAQDHPSQLFENRGDGTFVDVAAAAGVTNDRYGKGVTAGDFDDDGDLDLYVSNFGANRLYRNDSAGGALRFTDVAPELGVDEPRGRSFAAWFFDYDNDRRLDLFVTSYVGSTADLVAELLDLRRERPTPRLYRNTGGAFEDVTSETGLDRFFLPMGANFGDVDGDGWLDVYLTTGDPSLESIMPNAMLRNDRGERFVDVTTAGGFGHLQKGHGVAFCDLDNDGDQDVYHQLGGFYPGDRFHNALFLNPGARNRFLVLELVGTRSARDPIGARVDVLLRDPDGTPRVLHRAVGSVSSFGGSPQRLEVGLGTSSVVERVEVVWPRSGVRETFAPVEPDTFLRLEEGSGSPERLERKRVTF